MRIQKDKSFFGAVCLRSVWVVVLATFALWFSIVPQVWAQCTHTELYTFTGEASNDIFGNAVSGAGDVNNDGYAGPDRGCMLK